MCISVYDFPCVSRYEDRERQGERIHFSTCIHPSRATTTRGARGMGGGEEETLYVMVIKTSGTASAFGLQFSVSHCGHSRDRFEMSQDYLVTSSRVKAPECRGQSNQRHRNSLSFRADVTPRTKANAISIRDSWNYSDIDFFGTRKIFIPFFPFLVLYMQPGKKVRRFVNWNRPLWISFRANNVVRCARANLLRYEFLVGMNFRAIFNNGA